MKNSLFNIQFREADGTVASLCLTADKDVMNWCAEDGKWGCIHHVNYDNIGGDYKSRQREMELISFTETQSTAASVYANGILQVTAERSFDCNGNLTERFVFKNLVYADLFLSEHNCAVELPLNDRYTYADDSLIHCCNAHIWCGLNTTYVNALKMGVSNSNLGLAVTKGSFESYSVLDCASNKRGRFLLNLSPIALMKDEEYTVEWVIFPHTGKADFFHKVLSYPSFIEIQAKHYTIFKGEKLCLSAKKCAATDQISIYDRSGPLPYQIEHNTAKVSYLPQTLGERRIFIKRNNSVTYADFIVKESFETLLKNRIDFIVSKQQYRRTGSPLDGAFLIYDNKKEHLIFEDCISDHNACRERIGMGLLLAKYLQTHESETFYQALIRYIAFVKREFYDEGTGYVYNTIGKDNRQLRLYNAPWVSTLFTEMYTLTGDADYLCEVLKLLKLYYEMGGANFYPNGLSLLRTASAFKKAEMHQAYRDVFAMFKQHADTMVSNHTSYPRHEVNYEQTIVSPAATYLSEFSILSGDQKYAGPAGKHIEILARFSGSQPSFHCCEIPIRYWDDYWFGKRMLMGDTFPHYWSCLTARAYKAYYDASGKKEFLNAARECIRNCLCLFAENGRGSAAYIYPYKTNGAYGEMYDEWANDQDFALYFALETGLLSQR